MSQTIAYGIRFSAGWWSGQAVNANKIEMQFSYDILDATLLRDRSMAETIAVQMGGTVKQVELIVE